MESLSGATKLIRVSSWVLLFVLLSIGCTPHRPFDKNKWKEMDDMEYPYRKGMIDDLTKNYKLKGLAKKEWLDLLGEPISEDSLTCFYDIDIHWDVIDPDYVKTLVLDLNPDSSIKDYQINEWKKH